ncbi:hypothetical protein DFJ74DRAFT_704314 [Hyaloraphidium curvatum]|nr:hypothetical protein DFJ74DRAFT_704314 [Hyaloraphidium curvatum]
MMASDPLGGGGPPSPGAKLRLAFNMRLQKFLDDVTPYWMGRWIAFGVILALYFLRVFLIKGWYIVTYAMGIFILNQTLAFLSPKIDPAYELDTSAGGGDDDDSGESLPGAGPSRKGASGILPMKAGEEFKPFIRRLPEFKYWYNCVRAVLVAFFCTFFSVFDVPVFWPILVLYFCILFYVTMKRQLKHMIRYRYIPFDLGKPRFTGGGGGAANGHAGKGGKAKD